VAYVLCHKWDHGLIGFQKFLSVSIFNISHVGNIGTYIFKVNASQHVREASCVWKWAIYLQFCSLIGKVMIHPQIGGFSPKSSGTKPNMYPRNLLITMVWREAHPRPESVHIHHNFPQHRGLPKKRLNSTTRGFPTISRIRSSNWDPKKKRLLSKTPTLSRIAQYIPFQSPYHLMIRIETPSKHQFLVGCFQKFIQVQLWPDFMMISMFELPSKASFPCAPPIYGDCGDALWLGLSH